MDLKSMRYLAGAYQLGSGAPDQSSTLIRSPIAGVDGMDFSNRAKVILWHVCLSANRAIRTG